MAPTPIDETARAAQLLLAQDRAAALFAAVTDEGIIRPGVRDSEATQAIVDLAAERFGVEQHWHKRIVRSGPNTLRPYQEDPPDRDHDRRRHRLRRLRPGVRRLGGRLRPHLGPRRRPREAAARDDLADGVRAGKRYFATHPDIAAAELFAEVLRLTAERGWEFGNIHCGHLVGEFPHENLPGGRFESLIAAANTRQPLRRLDPSGRIAHWILEVHLVDREREIGGFYEELLTLP